MRQNGRWRLTDFQRLLAVLMAAIASFLLFMSLGLGSPILLVISLSLLVLVGLGVFLLGLRYSGRGPVQGEARVLAVPPPPPGMIVSKCDLRLEVELPGLPPQPMRHRDPSVSVTKWPRVGAVLPVEVDQRARSLRVRWDRVQPNRIEPGGVEPSRIVPGRIVPNKVEPDSVPVPAGNDAAPFFTDYADGALEADRRGGRVDPGPQSTVDEPSGQRAAAEATGRQSMTIDVDPEVGARAGEFELPRRSPGRHQPDPGRPDPGQPSPARPDPPQPGIPQPRPSEPPGDDGAMGAMLVVSDLSRSLRFYRDLVGLRLIDQAANTAVLSFGAGRIVLRQLADMSPVERRVSHLHIKVTDVDARYRDLLSKGVPFVHAPRVISVGDRLDLWAATFRDPDGHDIALTQWRDR